MFKTGGMPQLFIGKPEFRLLVKEPVISFPNIHTENWQLLKWILWRVRQDRDDLIFYWFVYLKGNDSDLWPTIMCLSMTAHGVSFMEKHYKGESNINLATLQQKVILLHCEIMIICEKTDYQKLIGKFAGV